MNCVNSQSRYVNHKYTYFYVNFMRLLKFSTALYIKYVYELLIYLNSFSSLMKVRFQYFDFHQSVSIKKKFMQSVRTLLIPPPPPPPRVSNFGLFNL